MCTLDILRSTSCCLRSCRTSQGLARLEAAIDCPYVSSKSLQALNQAYVQLHASTRHGVAYMQVTHSSTLGIVPSLQVPPFSHSDVVKHKQACAMSSAGLGSYSGQSQPHGRSLRAVRAARRHWPEGTPAARKRRCTCCAGSTAVPGGDKAATRCQVATGTQCCCAQSAVPA